MKKVAMAKNAHTTHFKRLIDVPECRGVALFWCGCPLVRNSSIEWDTFDGFLLVDALKKTAFTQLVLKRTFYAHGHSLLNKGS